MFPGSPTDTSTKVDAVVVGAGIAGLVAARGLVEAGLSAAVLEARERVGGRLLSAGSLDLGATWFWPNEPRIQKLIAELGLWTHPQYLAGDALFHSPEGAQRLAGNPIDVPSGRLAAGCEVLAQAAAGKLPEGVMRLGHPVEEIRARADSIEARTSAAVVGARHLVLAVPPALAVSRIRFTPELPERLFAIAARTPVWMAAMTKVVARYREPFWRRLGLAGAAISHLGPMREIHDMSGPGGDPAALFGFAPATTAGQAAVTVTEALGQFVELFGPQAGEPVELLIQDWRTELHTSPPGVERLTSYELFGHESFVLPALNGRLHWASTETSSQSPGHIEGALTAASRAIRAVLDAE